MRIGAAALAVLIGTLLAGSHGIRAGYETERTLAFRNIHNGESISIVYKRNGEYIPEAMEKLNWFFRDWRRNEPTKMDRRTIDLVWEIYTELGSKVPIQFVSGYRSAKTNESLRRRGGGQAKRSQHVLGRALDVAFPDVPVQKLRYAGLVREAGGVGYYPTSGIPFVHIDSGAVRMWPRMPRHELALLFPKGRSRYTPSDGRPITPADVKNAQAKYTQLAESIAAFHQFRAQPKDRVMVASLEPQDTHNHAHDAEVVADGGEGDITGGATASLPPPAPVEATAPIQPAKLTVKAPKPVVASLDGLGGLVPPRPIPAVRPVSAKLKLASIEPTLAIKATVAARPGKEPAPKPQALASLGSSDAFLNEAGWASGPEADDDHDNELSFRPFPLGGLIEADPSIDNPILSKLTKPDLGAAHDSIGSSEGLGMRFKQDLKVAELLMSDSFSGKDPMAELFAQAAARNGAGRLVKTATR